MPLLNVFWTSPYCSTTLLLIGQMSSAVNILSNLSCATGYLLTLSHRKDRSATKHWIQAFELLAKYWGASVKSFFPQEKRTNNSISKDNQYIQWDSNQLSFSSKEKLSNELMSTLVMLLHVWLKNYYIETACMCSHMRVFLYMPAFIYVHIYAIHDFMDCYI